MTHDEEEGMAPKNMATGAVGGKRSNGGAKSAAQTAKKGGSAKGASKK